MAGADKAAVEQAAQDSGDRDLPGWPRAALSRASNGATLPLSASVESAPATSADPNTRSAVNKTSSAIAVEIWVPLISASPSLGPSASGSSPSRASAGLREHFAA